MDFGTTAATRSAGAMPPEDGGRPAGRWSGLPHHRRRRTLALGGLIVLGLLAVLLLSGGGGRRGSPMVAPPAGFFHRVSSLAGSGPESFAGRSAAAISAAIDRTLAQTPYVRLAGGQHRELALTFDDGPGPYTPAILNILERLDVPATFFEVGVMEAYFHASTSEIAADGEVIGDHTFTHAPMSHLAPRGQRIQLLDAADTLMRYGAPFPRLFRPPYGLWDQATLALLRRYQMLMVLWTVDTNDWRRPGVRQIIDAAVDGARPGAIILLHDAGGDRSQTVLALPRIIAALRARGYRLVTVPQLLLDNPAPADQQIGTVIGTGG